MIEQFQQLGIDDSYIQRITVDTGAQVCTFQLDGALIAREQNTSDEPTLGNGTQVYSSAVLQFAGVRSISCEEGVYYLNSCIVDHNAVQQGTGVIRFTIKVTGGNDSSTFMRTLAVTAESFALVDG